MRVLKTTRFEELAEAHRAATLRLSHEERWLQGYLVAARAFSLSTMDFPPKIKSLLYHLYKQEAAYLIVGGYAVIHHGHMR